jgi:hypothetical protein
MPRSGAGRPSDAGSCQRSGPQPGQVAGSPRGAAGPGRLSEQRRGCSPGTGHQPGRQPRSRRSAGYTFLKTAHHRSRVPFLAYVHRLVLYALVSRSNSYIRGLPLTVPSRILGCRQCWGCRRRGRVFRREDTGRRDRRGEQAAGPGHMEQEGRTRRPASTCRPPLAQSARRRNHHP